MNKVILVKAFFCEVLEPIENISSKKKSGWDSEQGDLKSTKKHVEKKINAEKLSSDLELALSELYSAGYILKEVVTINSGAYGYNFKEEEITSYARPFTNTEALSGGVSYGYGYGYSYTDSIIVIGVKPDFAVKGSA